MNALLLVGIIVLIYLVVESFSTPKTVLDDQDYEDAKVFGDGTFVDKLDDNDHNA